MDIDRFLLQGLRVLVFGRHLWKDACRGASTPFTPSSPCLISPPLSLRANPGPVVVQRRGLQPHRGVPHQHVHVYYGLHGARRALLAAG